MNDAVAGAGLDEADRPALSMPDRWILSRLAATTAEVDALFEEFEFAKASDVLYHFAWDEFCDWYLELAKPTLNGPDPAAAGLTRRVLGHVLDQLLRLIHPIMPFVTDELWTALTGGDSVMVAAWPAAVSSDRDPAAEAVIEALMRLVTSVRRFRADQGLRPTQRVPAAFSGLEGSALAPHEASIRALLRLTEAAPDFRPNASVQAEAITVELDTSSAIDIAAERRRLARELAAAQADAQVSQRKLASESFLEKAPADVVAKSRERLAAAQAEIARLEERLAAMAGP